MKTNIQEMIEKYTPENVNEQKNVLKEVMQEIVLCGLSKADFFRDAAFYGGTALRIFYGLDRFSEDLDFSLVKKNLDFNLSDYFPALQSVVQSYGLNVDIRMKEKRNDSEIKSAFLKGDTIEHFLLFYPDLGISGINKNDRIKIKFEVDVNPPDLATFETRYSLLPEPYDIKLYDDASLFAGKIHAVICRSWKSRVKGRDLYDFVFYLSRNTKFNLPHLKERLIASEYISSKDNCELKDVKAMLINRFHEIDFNEAKKDVEPFLKNENALRLWNKDFFIQITNRLEARE